MKVHVIVISILVNAAQVLVDGLLAFLSYKFLFIYNPAVIPILAYGHFIIPAMIIKDLARREATSDSLDLEEALIPRVRFLLLSSVSAGLYAGFLFLAAKFFV